jgi:tetratricopeptide (TPR) repeat protein
MWSSTPSARGRISCKPLSPTTLLSDRLATPRPWHAPNLIIAFLLTFVLAAISWNNVLAQGYQPCAATNPVRTWIEQAEDQNRSLDDRLKSYKSAIQSCPDNGELYAGLAALLLQHQNGSGALEWARRGLKVAPTDPNLKTDLGVAQLAVGQPEEALSTLTTIAPSARTFFYLGMTYRALRDPQHAREAFSKALAAGYDDPYLLYVLIEQDREVGEKQAGLADFRTFYEKYPNSPWLHMLYGDAYSARNDNTQAEAEYKQAAQLDATLPIVHYQLGFLAFARGDYAQAADNFRQEIAIDPTFANAYLYLGTALRRLGRDDEALPMLQQAVARDPNFPLAYRSLAVAEIDAGQLQAALDTLRAASRRFPQEPAFPAQMASLLKRMGRPQEAKREADQAEALSKKNNPVHAGTPLEGEAKLLAEPAATTQQNGSRTAESGSVASNDSAASSPADANPPANSGGLSPITSEQDGQTHKLDPSLLPLYECVERSDAACAKASLANISESVKASPDYLELEAKTFTLTRDKDAAFAGIAKAVQLSPHEYRYRLAQGQIFQSFDEQAPAIQAFLQADQLQPHVSETFYFIGMSFFFLEDYPRAIKNFEEALKLDPKNDRALFMRGVSNMVSLKLQEAEADYKAAVALKPQNPFYHLHYGMLLSRMGDNNTAIAQAKIAENLDSSYPLTHYSLGHLYKETGDYTEARQELETAVKLRPSLSQAYYQLGTVYHHLGLEAKSQEAYQTFQKMSLDEKRKIADPMESDLLPAGGATEQR